MMVRETKNIRELNTFDLKFDVFIDFKDYIDKTDLDPEILMPMAERADVLFQQYN